MSNVAFTWSAEDDINTPVVFPKTTMILWVKSTRNRTWSKYLLSVSLFYYNQIANLWFYYNQYKKKS